MTAIRSKVSRDISDQRQHLTTKGKVVMVAVRESRVKETTRIV